jgi:protein-L-isoaspartate(D-aspartate) O-methyltransferase
MANRKSFTAESLVEELKEKGSLTDPRLEAAFLAVPRQVFLPDLPPEEVYSDRAIPIRTDKSGRVISSSSQPSMMLQMLEQLKIRAGDNVLEIGAGTGYNAAIINHLVGPTGKVTTVEIDATVARQAQDNLQHARASRVVVVNNDGASGYSPRAAYDRIICTASIWEVPATWVRQLKPDGILVTPIQVSGGMQFSAAFRPETGGTLYSDDNIMCFFVYMQGTSAGPEVQIRIGSTGMILVTEDAHRLDSAAIHLLLSTDPEECLLSAPLREDELYNFAPYLMLNRPSNTVTGIYRVEPNQKAYGIEGSGIAVFAPGSACFVPFEHQNQAHCFGGSDALIVIDSLLTEWRAFRKPGMDDLRLRLLPKSDTAPTVSTGQVSDRGDFYLHAWLHVDEKDDEINAS